MTINERIRQLRKEHLKMSQTEFADLIGMKQTSVSSFERVGATVTNQTIISICNAIPSLNVEWLRTGATPMFIQPDTFSLDRFITEHGATELEREIVKTYFELPEDVRQIVMEHFRKRFFGGGAAVPAMTPVVENREENPDVGQLSPEEIEERVSAYRELLKREQRMRRQYATERLLLGVDLDGSTNLSETGAKATSENAG